MCILVSLLTWLPGMGFIPFRTRHPAMGMQGSVGAVLLSHCWEVLEESRNMSWLPLVTLTYMFEHLGAGKSREMYH